jgi:hypothetical protein
MITLDRSRFRYDRSYPGISHAGVRWVTHLDRLAGNGAGRISEQLVWEVCLVGVKLFGNWCGGLGG